MNNNDLVQLVEIIKKNLEIQQIIIFGSYAHGTIDNESDIDICIITNEDKRKLDLLRYIRKLLYPFITQPVDLLVYKKEEFEERSLLKNTLEYKIKREGLVM